ncbi:hypothetical protein ABZT02_41240 [Streptomyces sp. NPDC005402]|uniref:hypothetical protein n=1 Tax=Streptomyces sp. NPDC005402 TaxID=3155338 RepID=UPI0033BB9B10
MRSRPRSAAWNWPCTGPWPSTADQETDRLDRAVGQLLAHTTPAYLLSAVGHALTRLPERPMP